MRQTRSMSALEAVANVAVGFWVGILSQVLVFPLFGFKAAPSAHLAIGAVFTVVSLVRSYILRRVFETIRVRRGRFG